MKEYRQVFQNIYFFFFTLFVMRGIASNRAFID